MIDGSGMAWLQGLCIHDWDRMMMNEKQVAKMEEISKNEDILHVGC